MDEYIFITGASSGFGEATAQLFASKGYPLILMARREERLLELKKKLSQRVDVILLVCDVRDEKMVNHMIGELGSSILEKIKNANSGYDIVRIKLKSSFDIEG